MQLLLRKAHKCRAKHFSRVFLGLFGPLCERSSLSTSMQAKSARIPRLLIHSARRISLYRVLGEQNASRPIRVCVQPRACSPRVAGPSERRIVRVP